jgi:protein-tyrosine phosphatase
MAEAVFKHMVAAAGLQDQFYIDSVGTSDYHIGDLAHPGTRRVLLAYGIKTESLSRQIALTDVHEADYIVAMDQDNITDLRRIAQGIPLDDRLHLLLDFADGARVRNVPDPYYTDDFEGTYRLVEAGCRGLLAFIRREAGI